MKVSVIGANGMLGYAVSSYFKRQGYNVIEITRKEFDIAKNSIIKLEKYLSSSNYVINCAGIIPQRIEKRSIEKFIKVNSIFPRNLSILCKKYNVLCFHITTDCVYSGKTGEYDETSYFDAEDVYGMTKNAGENTKNCMILRTSIIGEERYNKVSLLEWAKSQKGKEVNGFINHFWNGITTLEYAKCIEKIINQNLYEKGIFHIFSPYNVTKYELLHIINNIYNLNLKIQETKGTFYCNRILTSIKILCSKLNIPDIKNQIMEMKNENWNRNSNI